MAYGFVRLITSLLTHSIVSIALLLVTIYYSIQLLFPKVYSYFQTISTVPCTFVEELIKEKGLQAEVHHSITGDGCIITTHRIIPTVKNENNKKVVFLQHGLMETPSVYVVYEESLCIQLAKKGYDVWLGNNRSTGYGQGFLNKKDNFWNFTIDHIIKYDLVCQIETILKVTEAKKIAYFGQSQGCAQLCGTLHENPKLKEFIGFVGLITPAIYLKAPENKILKFLAQIPPKYWGVKEWLPNQIVNYAQKVFPEFLVGYSALSIMNTLEFIKTQCSVDYRIFRNVPQGTTGSLHLAHWFQLLHAPGLIRKFDYNSYEKNIYSKEITTDCYDPTIFDDLPVSVLLGGQDPVIDLEMSLKYFKNHKIHVEEKFGHIDFTWAKEGAIKATPLLISHLEELAMWK